MKIISVDVKDLQSGRVQLRRQQSATKIELPENESIDDANSDDVLSLTEMDAMRELGYQEGLKNAESELQIALKDLQDKHEAYKAMLFKEHQSTISHFNEIAESLNNTVDHFKDKLYEVCLTLSYEAIVKIVGQSIHDKTLITNICNSVCDDYSGLDCTIGISREDFPQVESLILPLQIKVDPVLKPGQCRVYHSSGYEETGIDVRLDLIKDKFLQSLQERG
jgi:flagellar biosynthesis/type III secretory pathway protein FliH